MADFLDSMAGYMSLGEDQFQNPEFEGKLSYYNNLEGVTVDRQVSDLYNRAVTKATTAARTAKSTKSSIRSLGETIDQQNDNLKDHTERLRDTYHKLRQAKREHFNTMPGSKEAARSNENIKSLKRQFRTGNKRRHEMRDKIRTNEGRLVEKKQEMAECAKTVEAMKDYRDRLIAGVSNQFDIVNRMQATLEHIKAMDLNAPGVNAAAINNFTKTLKSQKMKISLAQPLTDKSSDLMQAFNTCVSSFQDTDKKAIDSGEKKRITECKQYIKALQEFRMPDPTR